MKKVLVNKAEIFIVSDSNTHIQTTFNPPIYLEVNCYYELAMVSLEM